MHESNVFFINQRVWAFVDKDGENYFDFYFYDKESAELMGKSKHCIGQAVMVVFPRVKKVKEVLK